jgi:riboflavin biosynthesis pyrimidine reductase/pyrimidine deaminase RibD-like protein
MSVDGHIDDSTDERLILSGAADLDRVDELRASCDAILVGANTVRRDNPRLLVRSADRRAARVARGLPANPMKVVITRSGDLDPVAAFFTEGDAVKQVYTDTPLPDVLADLYAKGVRRLMVEGGTTVHTQFLTEGLADELQLAVAPIFIGDSKAPRFVGHGAFRAGRMVVGDVSRVGDVVVLQYFPDPDRYWLRVAIAESSRCPPSDTAYPVGAVIVGADGQEIARGYSRETDPKVHAEEVALAKAAGDPRLTGATIYSSLEPCGKRVSRPRTCTQWIVHTGIPRVVFALREPSRFVVGEGAEVLAANGVTVVEIPELAEEARQVSDMYK